MVGLDMVHVSYFGGFLSICNRVSFEQNMLFMLCSAKSSLQDTHLKAVAKAAQEHCT